MKIVTYLGFTLLSILVQFAVMDYIQERLQVEKKPLILNVTSHRKQFRDILREYTNKPHALYYRTGMNQLKDNSNSSTTKRQVAYSTFIDELDVTSENPTTTFEEMYDENVTMTDIDTTTDSFYTSPEIDNVTELILFEKKNATNVKPNAVPKRNINNKECDCNFLFKVCDINCCCDADCTDENIRLFSRCHGEKPLRKHDMCYPDYSAKTSLYNPIDNFLCIAKTNLAEKRTVNGNKYDSAFVARTKDLALKWHNTEAINMDHRFVKEKYTYGDHIWLMINDSINYLDVPSSVVNSYCTGRKKIQFLKNERVACNVKLTHLEMIQILKAAEESSIISVTELTGNATVLNCSTLQCTNWSVLVCDDTSCTAYNKSSHEPFCTDSKCTYIALKMDYIFYIHDSKIVNATLKLYTQNVSMILPFMPQEIGILFYLANTTIDKTIKFSGSPGYLQGLPVIASFVENNHTDNFFNTTSPKSYLTLPFNEKGRCVIHTKGNLQYGVNKRTRCRFYFKEDFLSRNGSIACKMMHNYLYEQLRLNHSIFISPNGNPLGQKDDDWIPLIMGRFDKEIIHGEFIDNRSKITCLNIVTKILFIFTHADKSGTDTITENHILTANMEVTTQNITLNVDDLTTVLTFDTAFVDVTKPPVYEFAGSPDLKFHLPKDFFFPFPNDAFVTKCNVVLHVIIYICGIVIVK